MPQDNITPIRAKKHGNPEEIAAKSFLRAAGAGNLEAVKKYIIENQNNPSRIKAVNRYKQNALHMAAYGGSVPVVLTLIEAGISVNSIDNSGSTPLSGAAFFGQLEVVQALLKNGANDYLQAEKEALKQRHTTIARLIAEKRSPESVQMTYDERLKNYTKDKSDFLCPISGKVMEDPVTVPSTGITYDRDSLFQRFQRDVERRQGCTQCVRTGKYFGNSCLQEPTNVTIKNLIVKLVALHEKETKQEQDQQKFFQSPSSTRSF